MNKFLIISILPLIFIFSPISNIEDSINNLQNHSFSFSKLPQNSNDYYYFLYYYQKIDDIKQNSNLTKSNLFININYLASGIDNKWTLFKSIVDYAYHRNIFIWIESTKKRNLELEYEFYLKIRKLNYTNVGISLATNDKKINHKVDNVLDIGGSICLVKGAYKGDITAWDIVSENYRINAEKLIKFENNHILATHDFELLNNLKEKYNNFRKIGLSFNYNSINFVLENINKFKNPKSFQINKGDNLSYLINNFWELNILNILSTKIKNLKYIFNSPTTHSIT